MKKIADFIRMVLVSPEVTTGILVWAIYLRYPQVFLYFLPSFRSDEQWKLPALIAIPIALLLATYHLGSDILSPQGKRAIILDWPDYWRLKMRVVWCLLLCIFSILATVVGYYLMHKTNDVKGLVVVITSWAISAVAVITAAYAKWTTREILGE